MTTATIQFGNDPNYTLDDAFPLAASFVKPLGNQVVVQLRTPRTKSGGGIMLTSSDQSFDETQIRVGKVMSIGPIAYKHRETNIEWPEGAWVKPDDFVRVPAFGGIDRWKVPLTQEEDPAQRIYAYFGLFNDFDMKGLITGDPLSIVDYM